MLCYSRKKWYALGNIAHQVDSYICVWDVCVCVCLHMCMLVFCPCALRSPSWTGCLAIINLSQHLKSHLR